MKIRDAVIGIALGLPLLNGCASHDKSTIEKPLANVMHDEAPGLALYDGDKNNRLDTNEALNYIRARILLEHGKNGQLTDKAIRKIQSISSELYELAKNYGEFNPLILGGRKSGPIITNYRDSAKAFDDALEILLKEEKDSKEKLVKSENK